MKHKQVKLWTALFLVGSLPALGQQRSASATPDAAVHGGPAAEPALPAADVSSSQQALPRLIKFSGAFTDVAGSPLTGMLAVTFTLYKQEADQEPLWIETQSVEPDKDGRYTVLLGATKTEGLPAGLFSSGEARWLGIEIAGQPQQPRTLLVSVPYALKAAEADKLAGKSASDFVLSESLPEQVRQVMQEQGQSAAQPAGGTSIPAQTFGTASHPQSSPASKFPPSLFSGTTTSQVVQVQQNGSGQGLVAFAAQNNALVGQSNGGTGNNGVFGQSGGILANGVIGLETSTSLTTFQNGVYGQTAGSGSGVSGISTNPAAGVGVYGQTANFAGVMGNSTATTGPSTGVFGFTSNGAGTGVSGATVSWVGVGGQATATSGVPAYGVWGDTLSTDGVAIAGFSDATTGPTIGVYGSDASDSGSAIYGTSFATSGGTNGVVGQVFSPNGTGGVFINQSGLGLVLQGLSGTGLTSVFSVDSSGNLQISGNLTVTGTKSSTAKLQDGREVALYAVESPENWFEDFGSGELKQGVAWIPIDSNFAQATNANLTYHVFLTPNGDSNGLYVSRKTSSGFEVREHGSGASNVRFDYRIVAKRRGYESVRMAEVQRPKTAVSRQLLQKRPLKITAASPKNMPPALQPVGPLPAPTR